MVHRRQLPPDSKDDLQHVLPDELHHIWRYPRLRGSDDLLQVRLSHEAVMVPGKDASEDQLLVGRQVA
jgi:hypothetical protein